MRQRITFIHEAGQGLDPAQLTISDTSVSGPAFQAVREDKSTLTLDEIPAQLSQILREDCEELHVRWVSPSAYRTLSPLDSRLSPGFHLFLTPSKSATGSRSMRVARELQDIFGITGLSETPQNHFTAQAKDSSKQSGVMQYYEALEGLLSWESYSKSWLHIDGSSPGGNPQVDASSLDISYEAASGAVKVTTQWRLGPQSLSVHTAPGHRTEVGILTVDPSVQAESHEVGISGGLTVIGDQKTPSGVMFAVPARHRTAGGNSASSQKFAAAFLEPTGLHPTLQIRLSSSASPETDGSSTCAPHAYLTLPRTIFADRYQLSDDLFLASKNLTALRYSSSPVDLEAPAYATEVWGSNVLLELAPPPQQASSENGESSESWTAEVPLHLRYLTPNSDGYETIEVPYPAVFWACNKADGTEIPSSPFGRSNLGYDALFDPSTVFWHVEPEPAVEGSDRLMSSVRVPVLDMDDAQWARNGTALAILLGFGWVLSMIVRAYLKTGYGRGAVGESTSAQKKRK